MFGSSLSLVYGSGQKLHCYSGSQRTRKSKRNRHPDDGPGGSGINTRTQGTWPDARDLLTSTCRGFSASSSCNRAVKLGPESSSGHMVVENTQHNTKIRLCENENETASENLTEAHFPRFRSSCGHLTRVLLSLVILQHSTSGHPGRMTTRPRYI